MRSGVMFGRASALLVFVAVFLSVASAQDDMVASAMKAAAKAVGPSIAAAKFGVKSPTMQNVAEEAARRQKIADEEIVRAYNEFKASPVQVPTYSSPAEANFTERFMNLFKPNLAMPQFFGQAPGAAAPGTSAGAGATTQFSMFAPAPPPPSVHGKPPPPPGCLPPGEPRRLWAREQVMNVDAKHRSTATMACAYECALRCSPCKDKPNPNLGRKVNNIFGATSFIERSITMQKIIEDGNHDMAKCETECTPGCMKNPAVVKPADGKAGPSSFLQVGSSVEAPKLTPKQTLLLRAHMAQKFQASGSSQLKSNSNSKSKIVKPTYADQRGISDGSPSTAHRFQAARLGGTTHNLGAASAQAGMSESGKAGAGGPWWLNPPPWWLPPPPEWGSPPPSVYSPFYSPYSISQPQGANAGQNHAPAYSPTPLPYFFFQTGENVEQRHYPKQN